MSRIPLFPTAEMTPEQRRVYETIVAGPRGMVRGPLRAALHRPELADKWQQLGELLRYRTSLSPRLSELAILITARHWDSQFEWHAHEPIALAAGLPRAIIDALRRGEQPICESAEDAAVYDYVSELLATHHVSDAVYARALAFLQALGLVELTALTGYYSMVALTLNAHEIPLPAEIDRPLPARL